MRAKAQQKAQGKQEQEQESGNPASIVSYESQCQRCGRRCWRLPDNAAPCTDCGGTCRRTGRRMRAAPDEFPTELPWLPKLRIGTEAETYHVNLP